MSGQMKDIFIYKDEEYSISAIEFPKLFLDVNKLRIEPIEFHTACWRGYIATFAVSERNQLVLHHLYTNNGNKRNSKASLINNKLPKVTIPQNLSKSFENYKEYHYNNIDFSINYSGSIIITNDFISEKYVHMGFQSPFSYEILIQLTFKDGKLIASRNLSDIAKLIREKEIKPPERNNDENHISNMLNWINDCFDISFAKKVNKKGDKI